MGQESGDLVMPPVMGAGRGPHHYCWCALCAVYCSLDESTRRRRGGTRTFYRTSHQPPPRDGAPPGRQSADLPPTSLEYNTAGAEQTVDRMLVLSVQWTHDTTQAAGCSHKHTAPARAFLV